MPRLAVSVSATKGLSRAQTKPLAGMSTVRMVCNLGRGERLHQDPMAVRTPLRVPASRCSTSSSTLLSARRSRAQVNSILGRGMNRSRPGNNYHCHDLTVLLRKVILNICAIAILCIPAAAEGGEAGTEPSALTWIVRPCAASGSSVSWSVACLPCWHAKSLLFATLPMGKVCCIPTARILRVSASASTIRASFGESHYGWSASPPLRRRESPSAHPPLTLATRTLPHEGVRNGETRNRSSLARAIPSVVRCLN